MSVEQLKALYRKQLQDEQAIVNFGHAALMCECSRGEDEREQLIEFILNKTSCTKEELENMPLETLYEIHDEYYEWAIRGV